MWREGRKREREEVRERTKGGGGRREEGEGRGGNGRETEEREGREGREGRERERERGGRNWEEGRGRENGSRRRLIFFRIMIPMIHLFTCIEIFLIFLPLSLDFIVEWDFAIVMSPLWVGQMYVVGGGRRRDEGKMQREKKRRKKREKRNSRQPRGVALSMLIVFTEKTPCVYFTPQFFSKFLDRNSSDL
jgi:hypothetical protein